VTAHSLPRFWIDEVGRYLAPELARYLEAALPRYHEDFQIISGLCERGDVLEIGCYPYCMSAFLQRAGHTYTGLDKCPDRGSRVMIHENLNVHACDVETTRFPFESNSFDLNVFNEVIEHLRINPTHTLSEIERCLRPDGRLLLTTPNLYGIMMVLRFVSGKGIEDPVEAFEMLKTTGHMGHLRTYARADILRFLDRASLVPISIKFRPLITGSTRKQRFKRAVYHFLPRVIHDNIVVVAGKRGGRGVPEHSIKA
jgi:SAM-dependent methyltransferase